jgi:hypothetical protein
VLSLWSVATPWRTLPKSMAHCLHLILPFLPLSHLSASCVCPCNTEIMHALIPTGWEDQHSDTTVMFLYLDSKEIPYTRDLQLWKKAPIISKWFVNRYNNKQYKINASQGLSEKRSKPPKATNNQLRLMIRRLRQYSAKPLQLEELRPALDVAKPSSFGPPFPGLQIPPNSPGM